MSKRNHLFVVAAIAAVFVVPACGSDGGSAEISDDMTPEETANAKHASGLIHGSKADSNLDATCLANGWIGDGECDSFCSNDTADCGGVAITPVTEPEPEPEPEPAVEEPQAPADPWAQAKDVTKAEVKFDLDAAPELYKRPQADNFSLGGTEFWQKWEGGESPTFSFSVGTDAGRTCMQASAIRWETIMADPPQEITDLKANSNWSGSFFNWNDDFSKATYDGARGAVLWAWRTSLIKWISQTGMDGTCYLPTRDQLVKAAKACAERGAASDPVGEIQGCQARN